MALLVQVDFERIAELDAQIDKQAKDTFLLTTALRWRTTSKDKKLGDCALDGS